MSRRLGRALGHHALQMSVQVSQGRLARPQRFLGPIGQPRVGRPLPVEIGEKAQHRRIRIADIPFQVRFHDGVGIALREGRQVSQPGFRLLARGDLAQVDFQPSRTRVRVDFPPLVENPGFGLQMNRPAARDGLDGRDRRQLHVFKRRQQQFIRFRLFAHIIPPPQIFHQPRDGLLDLPAEENGRSSSPRARRALRCHHKWEDFRPQESPPCGKICQSTAPVGGS